MSTPFWKRVFRRRASGSSRLSRDRTARVWNTETGQAELVLREGHAYLTSTACFFTPPHRQLLTAAVDGTARIWNRDTGTEQTVLTGIGSGAAAAVSADGRWVATSAARDEVAVDATSGERFAKLWDAQTGQVVRLLGRHQAAVTSLAFSADSQWLFTGDANGRGHVWQVETGQCLATLRRHTARISTAVFTPSGDTLLTSSEDKTVFQWPLASLTNDASTETQELVADDSRILRHPAAVNSLALTPKGDQVLTGCQDGVTRLWVRDSAAVIWQWQSDLQGNINAVDISPQGTLGLAVDVTHNLVYLLDMQSGQEVQVLDGTGVAGHFLNLPQSGAIGWSANFSPEGDAVVTVGGDEARLWDLQGRERMSFGPHRTVSSASFSPDGRRIVTASWDNSAKVWDALQGRPLLKLDDHAAGPLGGHQARVNSVAFAPVGGQIVSASDDGTLKIWDADSGRVLRNLTGHDGAVLHAAYSPDGQYVVSSSAMQRRLCGTLPRASLCIVWSATGWRYCRPHSLPMVRELSRAVRIFALSFGMRKMAMRFVTLPEQTDRVTSVAFSPSGTRALTGCADRTIKLWDAKTGREVLTLDGHTREVTSVTFSSDGRFVLSGGRDGTAIVWPTIRPSADGTYQFDVPAIGSSQ